MSKKTTVTGYRLVVEPVRPFYGRLYKADCELMADQIKRHVDDVRSVEIVEESEHACEHCGALWTEESDKYNGGCCDEDEKNAPVIPQMQGMLDMVNALSIRKGEKE